MTLNELIRLVRTELDDLTEPYLWSDAELIEYANDAQIEACRRARLLVDSSTAALCQITVTANNPLVTLDPRVLFVRRVRCAGELPLIRVTMQDMESFTPYWQDAVPGLPRRFVTDYESGKLLLWPTPSADVVLLLTVVRDPMVDMAADGDTPEIPARQHRSLRYWMAYRAYSKQDADANDPKKALQYIALFEQEFGHKSSAIDENWIAHEQMTMDGTY